MMLLLENVQILSFQSFIVNLYICWHILVATRYIVTVVCFLCYSGDVTSVCYSGNIFSLPVTLISCSLHIFTLSITTPTC